MTGQPHEAQRHGSEGRPTINDEMVEVLDESTVSREAAVAGWYGGKMLVVFDYTFTGRVSVLSPLTDNDDTGSLVRT